MLKTFLVWIILIWFDVLFLFSFLQFDFQMKCNTYDIFMITLTVFQFLNSQLRLYCSHFYSFSSVKKRTKYSCLIKT